MTHSEILAKAVAKAWSNGYRGYEMPKATAHLEQDVSKAALLTKLMQQDFAPIIIFRHDFAKAFWGDKLNGFPGYKEIAYWQYRLQQMVLEEDPIKYLEKFL